MPLPSGSASAPRDLAEIHIAVVGIGGLGAAAARAMAGSGLGKLTLFDADAVELSNLPRQTFFRVGDIGRPKAEVAAARLHRIDPALRIETEVRRIDGNNGRSWLGGCDLVLDCTDSAAAKDMLNRALVELRIPFVHAGVTGLRGQLLSVIPRRSPCLRCTFPDLDEEDGGCSRQGVVAGLPALFGALQAAEALRHASGRGFEFSQRLLRYDAARNRWHLSRVDLAADCPVCA